MFLNNISEYNKEYIFKKRIQLLNSPQAVKKIRRKINNYIKAKEKQRKKEKLDYPSVSKKKV